MGNARTWRDAFIGPTSRSRHDRHAGAGAPGTRRAHGRAGTRGGRPGGHRRAAFRPGPAVADRTRSAGGTRRGTTARRRAPADHRRRRGARTSGAGPGLRAPAELPGFLINRVQVAIQREVWDLVERGVATREEIDDDIRGTVGFRFAVMGTLEIHDFAGLAMQLATDRNLVGAIRGDTSTPAVTDELVAAGHPGIKSGRGSYDYPPERLVARRTRRVSLLLELWKPLYRPAPTGETSMDPDLFT